MQANQRYASDWGYRKAVDRGEELTVLTAESVPVDPVKKRDPKPVARRKPPAPTAPVEVVEEPMVEAVEPAPEEQQVPEVVAELPRPRGHRVLQESLLTLTESIEMQRGVLVVMERALRATRQEVIQLRKELEEQEQA
ncbi:hypothetical protein DEI95_13165 [Curtobacterium sp. MCBD17_008]|nr:hypothetical protein DEI95_13165 [Curtobacterium sp. MCBD17_008]